MKKSFTMMFGFLFLFIVSDVSAGGPAGIMNEKALQRQPEVGNAVNPDALKRGEPVYCSETLNPSSSVVVRSPFCNAGGAQPHLGCLQSRLEELQRLLLSYNSLGRENTLERFSTCSSPNEFECPAAVDETCRTRAYIRAICACVREVNDGYDSVLNTCPALNNRF